MKTNPFRFIATLIIILVATSACRKKAEQGVQSKLSVPERSFTSPSIEREQEIPAEIEVKASSGPIELSLGLYKTKIDGFFPRFRVCLKNRGNKKIRVLTEPFTDPFVIQEKGGNNNTGTYLEVLNLAGETPPLRRRSDDGFIPSAVFTEKDQTEIDELEKRGVRGEELSIRVTKLISRNHPTNSEGPPSFWMEPGASTATTAWASRELVEGNVGNPEFKIIGDFAQLSLYDLRPGKYRVRAVYDEFEEPKYFKKNHITPEDWFVRVKIY
jgi:hypothetical protein